MTTKHLWDIINYITFTSFPEVFFIKKLYFIFNPLSGKKNGKDTLKSNLISIIDEMTKSGYEVTIRPTQCRLDACKAAEYVCSNENFDIIACSGGDGTLNEVIQGIMTSERKVPVLYMPTGTTNDFARSLGISTNPYEACRNIEYSSVFSCDICSFNDRFFTYVAAFGIFTEVVYETPQQSKNMLGHIAYILEGMKRLNTIDKSYHIKITYDENTLEDDFILGMITNSTSVGGLISTSSSVSLNDGIFEVTLIKKPHTIIELQDILSTLLSQKKDIDASSSEYIVSLKTSCLKIESETEISWTLDGEFGGTENNVTIQNHVKAVDFIINSQLKA